MPGLDPGTWAEAVKWGPGYVMAIMMFVWIVIEKRSTEHRLGGLLHRRQTDRDEMRATLVRIETYLSRADAFEQFAREVMAPGPHPMRRRTDRLLAEAMARAAQERTDDAAADDAGIPPMVWEDR